VTSQNDRGAVTADHRQRHLLGRSSELDELTSVLEAVVGGVGCTLLVEGEAGIGKTCLLEEALGTAGRLGLQVLQGTAEELERRRPFGAIIECLGIDRMAADARRAEIARILSRSGPQSAGSR
jgi:predicted ATPase